MTQPRHTADSITDDDLDQLYAELYRLRARVQDWRTFALDAETERMKLLATTSSEDGQAVRMATRFAEKANENQRRAEKAEAALNAIRSNLSPLKPAIDCLDATCRYHGDRLDPDEHRRRYRAEACCDTGVEPRRAREAAHALSRIRAVLNTHTNPGDTT